MEYLEQLQRTEPKPKFVVASGSLPLGVPKDFYARVMGWLRCGRMTAGTELCRREDAERLYERISGKRVD